MRLSIPYGKGQIDFQVPEGNLIGVFPPRSAQGAADESKAVLEALLNPIESKPLADLAKGKNTVMIMATDISRPTKDHLILPVILDTLVEAGIKEKKITVIIARGQHRRMTDEEIAHKVGKEVLGRVTVRQHDPDNHLADIGLTRNGNRVKVNADVLKADLKISTGNIVPHRYAGYGGGAKSILPGVCGRETIYRNHLYVVEGKFERDALENNPVRTEMEEVAAMVGLDFIVNTVMNSDGQIVKVFAGHFLNAHRTGVKFANELLGVHVPSKAEVVVCSGSPMDISFYQASKALEMAESAVADNGTLILASPCYEGVGEQDLYRFLSLGSPERILKELEHPEPTMNLVTAVVAYLMAKTRRRTRIVLVSDGLTQKQVEAMGFIKSESVQVALDQALRRDRDSRVAVFPKAPITLPIL